MWRFYYWLLLRKWNIILEEYKADFLRVICNQGIHHTGLGLHSHLKGLESCPSSLSWLLGPSGCDADASMQVPADQRKPHREAGDVLAWEREKNPCRTPSNAWRDTIKAAVMVNEHADVQEYIAASPAGLKRSHRWCTRSGKTKSFQIRRWGWAQNGYSQPQPCQ